MNNIDSELQKTCTNLIFKNYNKHTREIYTFFNNDDNSVEFKEIFSRNYDIRKLVNFCNNTTKVKLSETEEQTKNILKFSNFDDHSIKEEKIVENNGIIVNVPFRCVISVYLNNNVPYKLEYSTYCHYFNVPTSISSDGKFEPTITTMVNI